MNVLPTTIGVNFPSQSHKTQSSSAAEISIRESEQKRRDVKTPVQAGENTVLGSLNSPYADDRIERAEALNTFINSKGKEKRKCRAR